MSDAMRMTTERDEIVCRTIIKEVYTKTHILKSIEEEDGTIIFQQVVASELHHAGTRTFLDDFMKRLYTDYNPQNHQVSRRLLRKALRLSNKLNNIK